MVAQSEKLSQRVKVDDSKEFFRISIRNCEYKTTMKFLKYAGVGERICPLLEGHPLLQGKCLCEWTGTAKFPTNAVLSC